MNVYKIVKDFEEAIAEFAGASFAVSVESGSAAIFLSCLYCEVINIPEIIIPRITYPSVPAGIIHAGGRVVFEDITWQPDGWYYLVKTNIIDSAKNLSRNSYIKNRLTCLSFHAHKPLGIGRGGMILTDDEKAVEWFKRARFDGRHEQSLPDDKLAMVGWNMYMTPEQAARGLELLQWLPDKNIAPPDPYQDLSKYKFYTEANR
jgi:dTDP-4-amino-4,6-dideoxygalactose transaminase